MKTMLLVLLVMTADGPPTVPNAELFPPPIRPTVRVWSTRRGRRVAEGGFRDGA